MEIIGKLKAKKINPNSQEFKEKIEKFKKAKKECLDRKNIDWGELSRTYITI